MTPMRILVVTSLFPYGQGEAFVAAELQHLSRCFGDIQLVPIFYTPGSAPRPVRQCVNLAYADERWGVLRGLRVAASLLAGLMRYRWAGDLRYILGHGHKLDNLKELVRALYRARLFERFLARQPRGKDADGDAGAFDLIYFYWMLPEILGALAFRDAGGCPVRIVSRGHGGDLYEDRKPGGYAGLRRGVIAGIDAVYPISDHGTRYLGERFPRHAAKFHTARLGVDDPGFLNVQPVGGALSLVSCSFVVSGKRLHLIVDAIAHLLAADPALELRWTHVGDGPLFDELRAHAAGRLGARARTVFKGYLTQAELMALYRDEAFDAIVNVSDNEGIPVSLMEASAAGIPMIATDVGGTAEIVNAANGVLIPADADSATIAAAILRLRDRVAARALRRSARLHWEAHFNAAANYERFGRTLAAWAQRDAHPATDRVADAAPDAAAAAADAPAAAAGHPILPRDAGRAAP
jgi:glycosyltransferase involved in cell wall biosynthesis